MLTELAIAHGYCRPGSARRIQGIVDPARCVRLTVRAGEYGLHHAPFDEGATEERIANVLQERARVACGAFAHFFGLGGTRDAQGFAAQGPRGEAVLGALQCAELVIPGATQFR